MALALALAVLTAGCATLHPPELESIDADPDRARCAHGAGVVAIAACEHVLARPDAYRWPGAVGASRMRAVHWARAHSAWHLARHLAVLDRREESLAAAVRSIELFERYEREGIATGGSAADVATLERQTELFRAYLARAEYIAGLQLIKLRRWSQAVYHLQRAVDLDGRHAVAWATLGVACNQSDEHAISARAFDRALAIEPGYFTESRSIQRRISEASRAGRRFELGPPRPEPAR